MPLDATGDHAISPGDALAVINFLNALGMVDVSLHSPAEGESLEQYLDVTGDGFISPVDALEVIDYINAFGSTSGEGEADDLATADTSPGAELSSLVNMLGVDGAEEATRRRRGF